MRSSSLFRVLSLAVLSLGVCHAADTHEKCQEWAEAGECDKNPEYMVENCVDACAAYAKAMLDAEKELQSIKSFYDLEAKDIDGKVILFGKFKDKVVIVTNVASYCGYTESHYKGLVDLDRFFKGKDVEILAFPCNQFGEQEPEACPAIKKFAAKKGVEFTMMDKIDVNGPNASLVYKYLKKEAGPPTIGWNFAVYFVISPDGKVESFSGVEPMELKELVLGHLGDEEL